MSARPFISYAREDREIAQRLYGDLRTNLAQPWIDTEDLLGGQDWEPAITKAIQECSHFLALISSNSVNKKGFVQKELRHALELLQSFPPAKSLLFRFGSTTHVLVMSDSLRFNGLIFSLDMRMDFAGS
jgi:hypothetical protein